MTQRTNLILVDSMDPNITANSYNDYVQRDSVIVPTLNLLSGQIEAVSTSLTNAQTTLQNNIDKTRSDLSTSLTNAQTTLQNNINSTNTKVNGMIYVKEKWVSGTSWYRVWSDGWIEQGGSVSGSSSYLIVFHKPFKNTNYYFNMMQFGSDTNEDGATDHANWNRDTTNAQIRIYVYTTDKRCWYACGY